MTATKRSDRDTFDMIEVEQEILIRGSKNYGKRITRFVAIDAPVTQRMLKSGPAGVTDMVKDGAVICRYRWPR